MTKRRACGRLLSRVFAFGLLIGALALTVGSAPAGAVDSPPEPLGSLQHTQWIAFTASPSQPSFGGTVTLSAQSGDTGGGAPPTTSELFTSGSWPTTWSTNGITLTHSGTPCPASAGSCDFTISGNPGESAEVLFGVGPVPSTVTNPPGESNPWTVTVPEPPTTTTTAPTTTTPTAPPGPNATFTGPPNNQLSGTGGFTFTAEAQTGQGPYTYTWVLSLLSNNQQIDTETGPNATSYTPPASIFTKPSAQYNLSLTVTDAVGQSSSSNVPFAVQTQVGVTPPQAPSSPPAAKPTATSPSLGPVLGRTTLNAVSYAPQLARFATPTPGAVQPVTVIWLWRPNWFQSAQTAKTDGRPKAVKRADVSVDPSHGGSGQSATPELAALAAFGIFGFGWVLFKRRRVRSALLD
jgi:hypothetical protein